MPTECFLIVILEGRSAISITKKEEDGTVCFMTDINKT